MPTVRSLLFALLLAGCAAAPASSTPVSTVPADAGTAGGTLEATGIVTDVRAASPARVSAFTLRTNTGETLTFQIGPAFTGNGDFPPAHLHEHLATAQPVRVVYRVEDGRPVAVALYDAP